LSQSSIFAPLVDAVSALGAFIAHCLSILFHPKIDNIEQLGEFAAVLVAIAALLGFIIRQAWRLVAFLRFTYESGKQRPQEIEPKARPLIDASPRAEVDSVSLTATPDQARVTFSGANLNRVTEAVADGVRATILFSSPNQLDVALPVGFNGEIVLNSSGDVIYTRQCDLRVGREAIDNATSVSAVNVPLYSDSSCLTRIENIIGLLTEEARPGQYYQHIWPVRTSNFQLGDFLRVVPLNGGVGNAWYRDPNTGEIRQAWSSSLIMEAQVLARHDEVPLTQLLILPKVVSLARSEARTLVARGVYSRGSIRLERDLSASATWASADGRCATVGPTGVLFGQASGSTSISCRFEDLSASAQARVETHMPLDVVTFFQGFKRSSQIAFDEHDNLFIADHSESIFEVRRTGGVEAVISLARNSNAPQGIDCLHISSSGRLFVNTIGMESIQVFDLQRGTYEPSKLLGASREGVKKCVGSFGKDVFIGGMSRQARTGFIITASENGGERSFATRRCVIYLSIDNTGNLYTTDNSANGIDVYSPDGILVHTIAYPSRESAGPVILDDSGRVYIGTRAGNIWRLKRKGAAWDYQQIASGLGFVAGLAIDSRGHLFASDFESGRISMIYPDQAAA
jgi:hypothetical protein